MLRVFRDNLRKLAWILWLVIAVFVLLVFTEFNMLGGTAASQDAPAATVGGREISFRDFQNQYRSLEDRLRAAYGDAYSAELSRQMGVPMQAMNTLISQQLLLDEAERMGLQPTDEELRRAILEVPVFQDDRGNFVGYEEYRRVLQANRIPIPEFERSIREQVLLQKLQDVLAQSTWVSDEEVERHAREQAERARIDFVSLGTAELQGESIEVGDAQLQAYFEQHAEDYRQPERRKAGYLSVNANTIRAGLEIPEEDLRAYYDSNPQEFSREEQVRAQHILLFVTPDRTADEARSQLEAVRRRIEAGEQFGPIAAELSEDEASKDQGGDLGFFPRGRMTGPFEEAAFGAAEGELVGPIENQLGPRTGYHLIQVVARQEGGAEPFESAQNRIRVRMLNERARGQSDALAQELYQKIKGERQIDEAKVRSLGEREGVGVEILEPFARDESLPRIGRNTPFADQAFSLEPGVISEPVRIGSGWALIAVLEVREPRLPALDEVRDEVVADVQQEARRERAMELLAQARARIDGGATWEQAIESLPGQPNGSGLFGAREQVAGLGNANEVVRSALTLDVGAVGGPIATDDGGVLFRVAEREHFDPVSFEADKVLLREQLAAQRYGVLMQGILERRRGSLEIEYSKQFIDTFELADAGAGAGARPGSAR
ncbi:MAG TPA: SurA N-terminal domain-containing protein [Thermoanaerobaculia bacterium]|nr:SurA N-terminal domain-containing protein [Thermoanaerobaculia bacterium]